MWRKMETNLFCFWRKMDSGGKRYLKKTYCEWIKIKICRLVRSMECELQNIGAEIHFYAVPSRFITIHKSYTPTGFKHEISHDGMYSTISINIFIVIVLAILIALNIIPKIEIPVNQSIIRKLPLTETNFVPNEEVQETNKSATPNQGLKPTKYHYYPHNQHIYLLPECAVQQVLAVCNAVYVRLNYTQPLCACPSRYKEPCSASLNADDLHTTELSTDPTGKVRE
ncbi:hypothetical protein AGLY_008504 [Aphis glycines]|uniref:Uncharacterized protein n=1 Tax=Aphis glycines TaxID=307491 RepID=A0A6G0TKL0_APHGL|nr:hypothetical protein AGLY_008504 [Aphis glycines]